MYKNKKFTDLLTGKVVEVTDHFEDIVILDNKSKIKLNKLLDHNLYDEYIDPRNFFRNEGLVNAFTEKIRQLPTDNINSEKDKFDPLNPPVLKNYGDPLRPSFDEPAVLPYDPEEEKKELLNKAKRMMGSTDSVNRQIESFKSLLEETPDEPETETPPQIQSPIETVVNNRNIMNNNVDPIIQMFRNAKRNTDFKINFSINNKIPRIDFIEMMEDSYNTSIIDFLAEEFTNELLLKPELIKNRIKDQLTSMVYKNTIKPTQPESDQLLVEAPKTRKKTTKTND